jgi:hypothetical protein
VGCPPPATMPRDPAPPNAGTRQTVAPKRTWRHGTTANGGRDWRAPAGGQAIRSHGPLYSFSICPSQ